MPLKIRPTGLGSGTYKDNVDYNIFSGEWLIGRIYERNGFPDEVRLFWPLHREPFCPDGAAASLEGADLPQPALSILDTVCRGRLERSSRFGIR